MRIDVITKEYPPAIYGGAGVHVAELVKVLRHDIEVQVRCFGAERNEANTTAYSHPSEYNLDNAAVQTMATNLSMVSDVAGTSLVHSHTWYANFAGHIASKLHGVPHVITAHSLEPLRPWKQQQLGGGYELSSFLERSAYESATRIIAVSHGMKADILRAYPQIDSHKIAVIHNGIDLDAFQATSATETLEQLGINPSARSVVFVGRITQQKGLPYLLKAAKSLDPDVQLVLCAGAPDTVEIQNEVTALVEELKTLRSNVVWIERHLSRSELIAVLTSATVFACPSIYEPLGIVNLEAMACSVPVVATATGGIPEVVTHGETGLLVEIEQVDDGSGKPLNEAQFVEDFAAALNAVLADPNIKAMGAAGRRRVEENFAWSRIAKDTIELYRDAIAAFQ